MTIMFLTINEFYRFAAAKRFLGTGEELSKLGHTVYITAAKHPENYQRLQFEAPHCRVVEIPSGGLIKEIYYKLKAVWTIRPDFVYATSYTPKTLAFFRFLFPKGVKSIIEFNELYSAYSGHGKPWKLCEYIACRENEGILCASKVLESHFVDVCRRHRLHRSVCYSPFAFPEHLATRIAQPARPPVVMFMASLWKGYGVYDVIHACITLFEKGHALSLEILGDGPERHAIEQLVAERHLEEKIHIRGRVNENELNGYFSMASVFVAPLQDSFQDRARCPSKVYFYIPFNKPIVTCRFGDPYDTLQGHGYYYKPGDSDDMARMIEKAIGDSDAFAYPAGFVERHSWRARAVQFQDWVVDVK